MVDRIRKKAINALFPRDTHPELPLDPDAVEPGKYKRPLHVTSGLQLVVLVGGCFGTFARYEIANLLPDPSNALPVGTLLVNLLGAFLLGAILESLAKRGDDVVKRRLVRLGIGTGFMGAFTTYSTLAVEVSLLAKNGQMAVAVVYALLSVIGGLICCAAGIHLAEAYHRESTR